MNREERLWKRTVVWEGQLASPDVIWEVLEEN